MNHTSVIYGKNFKNDILNILKNIEKVSLSQSSIIEAQPYLISKKPFLRLLSLYDKSCGIERIILSILLESFYKSEKMSGDSGNLSLNLSINLLKNYFNLSTNTENFKNTKTNEIKEILKLKSIKPAVRDIKYLLNDSIEDNFVRDLVLECISQGGLISKIFIEETRYTESSMEITSGYNFNVQVPDFFFSEKEKWNAEHVYCIVIDGFINEVHEIHYLLEHFSKNTKSLAIFARGFSKDVLSTLRVNLDRGTLNAIPFEPVEAIENINLLNDISHVVGGDIVSPTKGDLISSIDIDSIPNVDIMNYSFKNIKIVNPVTSQNVKIHRENLKKRKEKEAEGDLVDILDKRLRGLSDGCIVVRLSKNHCEKREMIDYAFRSVESMIRSGYIRTAHIKKELKNKKGIEFKCLLDSLSQDNRKIYSSNSIYAACEISISSILNLKNCELAIIFD